MIHVLSDLVVHKYKKGVRTNYYDIGCDMTQYTVVLTGEVHNLVNQWVLDFLILRVYIYIAHLPM